MAVKSLNGTRNMTEICSLTIKTTQTKQKKHTWKTFPKIRISTVLQTNEMIEKNNHYLTTTPKTRRKCTKLRTRTPSKFVIPPSPMKLYPVPVYLYIFPLDR